MHPIGETDRTRTFPATPAARYQANLAAIAVLRTISQSARDPATLTDAERHTLACYTGFGEHENLARLVERDASARALIGDALIGIRQAAPTQFFTPPGIAAAIWDALAASGLDILPTPQIAEIACGTGVLLATMPPALRARATITALEPDPTASAIARTLHPDVTVHTTPLEAADLAPATFDLVITNVPFAAVPVFDPTLPPALRRALHDYCIVKALTLVRPGGVVAVLTSYDTLDKRDTFIRRHLASQAALITAIRLPQGVYAPTSSSVSGSDLLILRRHAAPTAGSLPPWVETTFVPVAVRTRLPSEHFTTGTRLNDHEVTFAADGACHRRVNAAFAADPDAELGAVAVVVDAEHRYLAVRAASEPAIATCLAAALTTRIPPDLFRADAPPAPEAAAPLPETRRVSARAAALLALYDHAKAVLAADLVGQDAQTLRADLNTAYADLLHTYGPIHQPDNLRALANTPELLFLRALEHTVRVVRGQVIATQADLFTHPTVRTQPTVLPGTLDPDAALLHCLNACAAVDLDRIARLCGRTTAEAARALTGRIFHDPTTQQWQMADAYLSGDVRAKLVSATAVAQRDPRYAANVQALETVQPSDLTPEQIRANLGAPWIPATVVQTFVASLLPGFDGSVSYNAALGRWNLDPGARPINAYANTEEWGTRRMTALEIIACALDSQLPQIYDTTHDGRAVLNRTETLLAQEKLTRINTQFSAWIWSDPARAVSLAAQYNQTMNTLRRRRFDGSHLTFPGVNTAILRGGDLLPHQKDAVWMSLQVPGTLHHLPVGAGKTFIGLVWAHELLRLDLARKVVIVVPNHLIEQWAEEAARLYPATTVHVMTPADFARQRRGVALSRIATTRQGIWLITQTALGAIEPGLIEHEHVERELTRYRTHLDAARDQIHTAPQRRAATKAEQRSFKQIERAVATLESRLKTFAHGIRHDSARMLTWAELGIDALFVDEADEYKGLAIESQMGSIPGVPSGGSQRAFDLFVKVRDMLARGGRVILATGTPLRNTIAEAYIWGRFLFEDALEARGIHHFDAWAKTFARVEPVFEMTPDGGGFRFRNRLCRFVNLPEWFQLWYQVTYARSKQQLALPVPTLVTGKPIPVQTPASGALTRYVQQLVRRVDAIRAHRVTPSEDNLLKVTGDGRKAALDLRLVLTRDALRVCKVDTLCRYVAELYHRETAARATQLIYCELGTPASRSPDTFCVYDAIRAGLTALGVSDDEIAFIQDHATPSKRSALFAALRRGDIRVLLCSKQSTGMNVQTRLLGLHHADAPWTPRDVEQREGRILRQGNGWPEVYVFAHVTAGSFDGFVWQLIETKGGFIRQFAQGDVTVREVDDIGDIVLSAAEIKALASGNPDVLRKAQREAELHRLESLHHAWRDQQRARRLRLQRIPEHRADLIAQRDHLCVACATAANTPAATFSAAISAGALDEHQTTFTKREFAGQAVRRVMQQLRALATERHIRITRVIGSYRGLTLRVDAAPNGLTTLDLCVATGTGHALLATIGGETDSGVFTSIDHAIRALERRIVENDTQTAALATEETAIAAALTNPWEHEAHTAQVRAELADLDERLTRAAEAAPAAEPAAASAQSAPETAWDDVLARIAADDAADAALVPPPVSIPPPRDLLAFAAARERLIADLGHVDDQAVAADEATAALVDDDAASIDLPVPPPTSEPVHGDGAAADDGTDDPPTRLRVGDPLPQPARATSRARRSRALTPPADTQQLALF